MKFNDYFHPRYITDNGKVCAKVSIEIAGRGMFSAMCNKDGSVVCEQYPRAKRRDYWGKDIGGCNDNIFCLAYDWTDGGTNGTVKGYSDKERTGLRKCIMSLPDAFSLLCEKRQFTELEKKEVMGHIVLLQHLVSNTASIVPFDAVKDGIAENTVRWKEVDLNTYSMQDYVDIAFACIGEYGDPAEYNGIRYKATKDEQGAYVLYYLAEDKPARTVAEVIAELQRLGKDARVVYAVVP